jgi:hypothetical protein
MNNEVQIFIKQSIIYIVTTYGINGFLFWVIFLGRRASWSETGIEAFGDATANLMGN